VMDREMLGAKGTVTTGAEKNLFIPDFS